MFDKIFAFIGAIILSQFPQIIQQYEFHLAGHLYELRVQVESMQTVAKSSGKTLELFIQKFTKNEDVDIASQGRLMQKMVNRFSALSDSYNALQTATLFARPFMFVYYLKWEILKESASSFKLGFSFNMEGMFYAFLGACLGFLVYRAIGSLYRSVFT